MLDGIVDYSITRLVREYPIYMSLLLLSLLLLLSVFEQTIKRSKCMREYIKSRPDEDGDKTKARQTVEGGLAGKGKGL